MSLKMYLAVKSESENEPNNGGPDGNPITGVYRGPHSYIALLSARMSNTRFSATSLVATSTSGPRRKPKANLNDEIRNLPHHSLKLSP